MKYREWFSRLHKKNCKKTDTYEDADYERIGVELASGKKAWVYIQKKN